MQKEKKRNRKLYLLKSETGMTIVELLITLAVGAIIIAVIYSIYISQIQGQATQRAALEMQQGLRAALIIMEREIRTAGADPLGIANTGVEFADFNDFHFTHDIRGAGDMEPDGNHDDPDENIRYCITGNGHLGRATAGSNTFQPILDNVDALNFVYLDRAGNRLNTPIADNNLNRIRQVQVTIVARYALSQGGLLRPVTDTNIYRNQQGDVILDAPNDNFRRLMMTTTITCRNMALGI